MDNLTPNKLNRILYRIQLLDTTEELLKAIYFSEEIEGIILRIKTLSILKTPMILEIHKNLQKTLKIIDSSHTRVEDIPNIVRDILSKAGLSTQLAPNQITARNLLKKAIKATEAYAVYFQLYPNREINTNQISEIAIRKLIKQKFNEE